MTSLCIIPARGGSKRIPRKNIKDFLGKPIIAYSIETAINSELFDEVMVSTDDQEIAEIARKYGASVPFLRSQKAADDHATTLEVINEVLGEYNNRREQFELVCCIYPTAPLIRKDSLVKAFDTLLEGDFDSVFPVVRFSYPIQRAIKIIDGKIGMYAPEHINSRSQDLPMAYHDAGQFYWLRTEKVLNQESIWTNNSSCIVLNESEVQDIDSEEDWKIAELKFRLMHNQNY